MDDLIFSLVIKKKLRSILEYYDSITSVSIAPHLHQDNLLTVSIAEAPLSMAKALKNISYKLFLHKLMKHFISKNTFYRVYLSRSLFIEKAFWMQQSIITVLWKG